jgi:hypothetical protein
MGVFRRPHDEGILGTMTRILPTVVVAVVIAALAAAPASARPGDKRAATKLLRGTVWSTHQSGSVTGASLDRTVTLCRDNTYVLVTSFLAPIIEDHSSFDHPEPETRMTGTWKVKRAELSKSRRFGTVGVAYTTDAGDRGTVVLAATRSGATFAGEPAIVSRTDAC